MSSSSGLLPSTIDVGALPDAVRGYKYVKHIQSGEFGCVWHAQTPDGQDVAVKVQRRHTHMIQHESKLLHKLSAHDLFVSPVTAAHTDDCAVLVTELCETDLLSEIAAARRLPLARAVTLFRQLLLAVRHLHSMDVYHCDLKPENILLKAGCVRVCDFGASSVGNRFTSRNLGSPQYLCPELFTWADGERVGMAAGEVWSLGVIFFTMLAGYQPWTQPTLSDIQFSHFVSGTMRFPAHFSPAVVKFCMSMLRVNPNERASVDQLLASKLMADGLAGVLDERTAIKVYQERREVMLDAAAVTPHRAKAAPSSSSSKASHCRVDTHAANSYVHLQVSPLRPRGDGSSPRCPDRSGSLESKESSASCGHPTIPTGNRLKAPRYLCVGFDDDDSDDEDAPFAVSPRVTSARGVDGSLCFSVHHPAPSSSSTTVPSVSPAAPSASAAAAVDIDSDVDML